MSNIQRAILGAFLGISAVIYFLLAFSMIVMNGTTSLPHSGYFMLRWPKLPIVGSYIAFDAPDVVAEEFRALSFVKRVAGVPGDIVTVEGSTVCVRDECRDLLPSLQARGYDPIASGTIAEGQYVVFGDADNSLDSRYAIIGSVSHGQIQAVGGPIPIPHWKEIRTWLDRS